MKESKDIVCCCVDNGLFLPVALKLSETYKHVYYHTSHECASPKINHCFAGRGFQQIERADDIWKIKDSCDLFVFPDTGYAGLQIQLEMQGKKVWGARDASSLELSREKFHRTLAEVGLPVPNFERIVGLDALKSYLRDKTDLYIKISRYRGNMETCHWRDWRLDEGLLDALAVEFGPTKEFVPFLVCEPIDTDFEVGGDTFCIDGKWPKTMLHGWEAKDCGYLGSVTERPEMPDQLNAVMDAFGPVMEKYRAKTFWSMEVRVKGDDFYFIDPTIRAGLPSTASQMELWKNYADIIWYGANGELVEPEPTAVYSCECILKIKGKEDRWNVTEFPPELQQWAKLSGCGLVDGRVAFPPEKGLEIGWMVSIGETMRDTIETMMEQVDILPENVTASTESLVEIIKNLKEAEEKGIEFADEKLPEPEVVVNNGG